MAWTTPRTWAAGELVTAAIMNTHVRDNLNFLAAAPNELWLSRASTAQSITGSTRTAITWNQEDRDQGFGFSPSGSTITCPETGIYAISLTTQWGGTGSDWAACDIDVNGVGTGERANNSSVAFINNYGSQVACSVTMRVQEGETIKTYVTGTATMDLQASGAAGTNLRIVQVVRRLAS